MAEEVERKYLVKSSLWKQQNQLGSGELIRQGYLASISTAVVRVRTKGKQAWITVKSPVDNSLKRSEYEYQIPLEDAEAMLAALCQSRIEKYRYLLPTATGLAWEIDEFIGDNQGLVIAEIELPDADYDFEKPNWLGQEVSFDYRYYNNELAKQPFCTWDA